MCGRSGGLCSAAAGVDALADEWEYRPCRHGKSVVACFHAPVGRVRG